MEDYNGVKRKEARLLTDKENIFSFSAVCNATYY